MIKSVEDLEVYQRSYRLALEIHKITLGFPSIERYELSSQMRRASKSIPTNIREGFGRRRSAAEYRQFLNIARSSCDEMFTHLNFAKDLSYISEKEYGHFISEYEIVGKQLTSLIRAWSKFK